jgi:outer membrane protein OmpA-like peptidoglycan-associated protein
MEWVASSFDVFGEVRALCPEDSMNPMDTLADMRFTASGRFKFGYAFALTLAYTFGLTKSTPNEAVLGFEWTTPFLRKSAARFGAVAGRTIDARTGAALVTKLSFPEYAKMPAVFSDSATGVFKVKKVPVGDIIIEARLDGYVTQAMPLAVTENQTITYDFHMRPTSTYGTVAGVVTDAATGLPLQATIEFPSKSIEPIVADAAGKFRVNDIETGIYTVTATLDNYVTGTFAVTVEDGKSTIASFALSPATSVVTMTGEVSDKKTGDALAATLTCTGTSLPVIRTDPASGMYKVDLPIGTYAIVAAAPGYINQTAPVTLEKDKPLVRDFELVKKGMAITLHGIYFDFNRATIKPESRPALDDAARTLKDNPTIIVEIQGYTDSQGSDEYNLKLSDQRASSVVDYLVHNYGISTTRLTAKGYGEAKPIAANDTDSGRALNRRVEFVILGQIEQK